MKALFEFIKTKINTLVPAIKHVEMWNGQVTRERIEKNQNPFRTPAVFVEFIVDDIQNFSYGIKNVHMTIRFRFALNSAKFTRLADLDFQETFDYFIQNLRGNAGDSVQFSSLNETISDLDEGFDAVNEPVADYKTVWRKKSANKRSTDVVHAPVAPSGTGEQL